MKENHSLTTPWAKRLWGNDASLKHLLLVSAVLLLCMLGVRDIWTQEWRWADISWEMVYRHDYLHPYLTDYAYYDKPLLSYWVMIAFSKLMGGITAWSLRLPSALAGICAVWCTYWLGKQLINRQTGLIAGWMLATTYYFIFWARTANSDTFNLAGILLALVWYFAKREQPGFLNYLVFFLILAITSLFKGLLGAVVPCLVLLPELLQQGTWKKHLRFSLLLALIPAVIVYLLPFWASTYFGEQNYSANGLTQVFRENILRFVEPFDHKGPIYTYVIYLPLYTFPWVFFFIPAIVHAIRKFHTLGTGARWTALATLVLFIFFTASGSRRSYYTLPMVPFAILMTANWVAVGATELRKRFVWAGRVALMALVVWLLVFGILQPYYYRSCGVQIFAEQVRQTAVQQRPWAQWDVYMLDSKSKIPFYLSLTRPAKFLPFDKLNPPRSQAELTTTWPVLVEKPNNGILISGIGYLEKLQPLLKDYILVQASACYWDRLMKNADDPYLPVAFIPKLTTIGE